VISVCLDCLRHIVEDFRIFIIKLSACWMLLKLAYLSIKLFTCAMETERKQHIESTNSLIPSVEVAFSHGESVAQMESSIHVGVGKSFEILGFFRGFNRKILVSFPYVPGTVLQ
jgi:hypothetical protein